MFDVRYVAYLYNNTKHVDIYIFNCLYQIMELHRQDSSLGASHCWRQLLISPIVTLCLLGNLAFWVTMLWNYENPQHIHKAIIWDVVSPCCVCVQWNLYNWKFHLLIFGSKMTFMASFILKSYLCILIHKRWSIFFFNCLPMDWTCYSGMQDSWSWSDWDKDELTLPAEKMLKISILGQQIQQYLS